jgi:periplasmic divalent cation tolerance protein
MQEFVQITTTTGDTAIAEQIAIDLVDRRLVACAQIQGPVRSVYRWEGKVESTEEWVVSFKTVGAHFEAIEKAIAELHPYDVPELIVVPIIGGSNAYLEWVREQSGQ